MKNNNSRALACFLLCGSLVGCGGGGGGGGGTTAGGGNPGTISQSNRPPAVSVVGAMTVNAGETVVLKATVTDLDDDPITYGWMQTAGQRVRIDDEGAASATFLAPSTPGTYVFHVHASDGTASTTSSDVTVEVLGYAGNSVRFTQNPLIDLAPIADTQALEVVDNRAYVAAGSAGLAIYDTSTPSSPVKLGAFNPASFNALHLAVAGNRVAMYGLASPSHGIRIVDVSAPSSPVALGQIDTGVLQIRDLKLSSDGSTLYVATDDGLRIYDLTNPASPANLTLDPAYTLSDEIKALQLSESGPGRTLYTLSSPSGAATTAELRVLNVTSPTTSLTIVGSLTGLDALEEMQLAGTRIYATGLNGGGLNILDVSTPQSPQLLGKWQPTGWTMRCVSVKQNTAFIGDWFRGVAVADVTDPTQVTLVGEYDTPGRVFGLALQNNSLFVADNGVGLQAIDVAIPSQPQVIRSLGTTTDGQDLAVRNGKAFLVDKTLTAYDVANPLTPSILGTYASNALAVALHNNYAVIAGYDGLNVINVRSPAAMSLTGSYPDLIGFTTYTSIALNNDYAYLGTKDPSLHTFDLGDVTKPTRIDTDSTGAYDAITALAIDDKTIHIGTRGGLFNADLTNPANPVIGTGGFGGVSGEMLDVTAVANTTIVSRTNYLGNFLTFLDTSALPTVSNAGEFSIDGNRIAVSGRHLYATQYHEFYTGTDRPSLYVFDIADTANPTLSGMFDLPSKGRKVTVSDGYVFVATKTNGLAMMQAEPVLAERYSQAAAGSALSYTVSWKEFPSSVAAKVKCVATGGVCSVTAIDQAARSATLTWTLPAAAGDYEMAAVVGDEHAFFSTRDRVTAQ